MMVKLIEKRGKKLPEEKMKRMNKKRENGGILGVLYGELNLFFFFF